MFDAMRHVIAQDFLLDPPQGRAHGGDLGHDVDAIAVFGHHAGEPAHLALDAAEPFERWRLAMLAHDRYIPPGGIDGNRVGKMTDMTAAHHDHRHDAAAAGDAIDPVCGMTVDPHAAKHRHQHEGRIYYFCSAGCRTKFAGDPRKYLGPRAPEKVPEGTIYACPMHPEIRRVDAGACPICGMALVEPETASTRTMQPLATGTLAFLAMLGIYFGVLTLVSGWDFTVSEFSRFWYYVLPLALGFGIQMGLYIHLRQRLAHHHTGGKIVVASGTTSTAAMLACCTHYLTGILPVIGAAGAVTLIAQYQVQLFWVGLAFNLAGIIFIGSRIIGAGRSS